MKINSIMLLALIGVFGSCDDNAVFEKEMYKNEVALISSDPHNIFSEVVALTGDEVIGYVAASVGGTEAPKQDLLLELEEDPEPLAEYNWSLYDADESLYAKLLPKDKYEIADYKLVIKAGQRTGRTMIKINPEGLSPDSTYFIGFRTLENSAIDINPLKNTILYQVLIENNYASQANDLYYSMTGTVDEMVTAANKKLFPLTRNTVRVVAGTETFKSNVDDINKTALVLEVKEDKTLAIKPYKDIDVQQIDGDSRYPNTFKTETIFGRTYNVFLLSYRYTINGVSKVMKEELRMEVTE